MNWVGIRTWLVLKRSKTRYVLVSANSLHAPSRICTCTLSQVWASYPMQYLQSFNSKPYEAIVRPGDSKCSVSEPQSDSPHADS